MVTRCWLVLSAIITNELGLRHIDTICISSYNHNNQRELNIINQTEDDAKDYILVQRFS
ncbi:MAG: hypothetical protein ACTS73_06040 [Arsenophonus sp. NEOnobi-MAG3]